jgi:hypothetical protein
MAAAWLMPLAGRAGHDSLSVGRRASVSSQRLFLVDSAAQCIAPAMHLLVL